MGRIRCECRSFIMDTEPWWNLDETVQYFMSKKADPLIVDRLKLVENREQKAALDLGCGGGRHTELLVALGFTVWACDVNESMVEATRARVPAIADRITQSSMLSLQYPADNFDVVVSTGVFHQAMSMREYETVLCEVGRVMRSNGILAMNIFVRSHLDTTLELISEREHVYKTHEGLHMTLLTPHEFIEHAERAQLELESAVEPQVRIEPTGTRVVWKAFLRKP